MLTLFNRRQLAQQNEPVIESISSLRSRKLPQGHYDRRSTGLSVDFVYKPQELLAEMASGGYGEAVHSDVVMQLLGNWPSESFRGVTIIGTDAGRYFGKRLVNHYENYGFGGGFMLNVTKVVAIIPLTDAMGCGECPGSKVVISPDYGFGHALDTLAHEHYHNIGLDHKYGKDKYDQLDRGNDPIYVNAAKVARYLSQFPEA